MTANFDRSRLISQVKEVLVKLIIFKQLSPIEVRGTMELKSPMELIESISTIAADALETIKDEDRVAKEVLISLCTLQHSNVDDATRIIREGLSKLMSTDLTFTDQDTMNTLEVLVPPLIREVQSKSSLEEAEPALRILEQLCNLAARLAFSGNARLSDKMDKLLRDFEHVDEEQVLTSIYQEMRSGAYQ